MNNKIRIGVLGSTKGTDMEAIISAINDNSLDASIEVVISDKEDSYILKRALQHSLNAVFINPNSIFDGSKLSREDFDKKIVEELKSKKVDLVLLIGYMKILSPYFCREYKDKILNVHPSLLPAFAGGMDLNVHEEVLKSGVKVTGCTVHFVDEGVDSGKIISQKWCEVLTDDTAESLKQKVQALEGKALIESIKLFAENYLTPKTSIIKRALISVSDKESIVEFARELNLRGVEIISTGNTAKILEQNGVQVTEISNFTQYPEMMDGRLKTLHPLVHGGILGLRDKHADVAKEHNIRWIDLVVCNLYPFSQTIQKPGVSEDEVIENIDIGGPTMIRSAAKNINWATVVVDKEDYQTILNELRENDGIDIETRKKLSAKAFSHTANYDSIIANHFKKEKFPEKLSLTFTQSYIPRYGENPHQEAGVYKEANNNGCNILNADIIQGKKLSYNNINDADGALSTLKEFTEPCCVVVKHANPCGVSTGNDIFDAYTRAYEADSLSAFGGVIAINRTCTKEIAEKIVKVFAEIVIAPEYDSEALVILSSKEKMRVLRMGSITPREAGQEFKSVEGGLLYQDIDTKVINENDLQIVTENTPSQDQMNDMLFAWKVLKHVKSNGILIAKNNTTVGVGAGQVSRVDAVELAIKKGETSVSGAILASDAFFPFRDSIDKIASTGIKAIIQPGGSIKDKEVIQACNEHGIAMVFTGNRCFKH